MLPSDIPRRLAGLREAVDAVGVIDDPMNGPPLLRYGSGRMPRRLNARLRNRLAQRVRTRAIHKYLKAVHHASR
jgi:hypothetical protein